MLGLMASLHIIIIQVEGVGAHSALEPREVILKTQRGLTVCCSGARFHAGLCNLIQTQDVNVLVLCKGTL